MSKLASFLKGGNYVQNQSPRKTRDRNYFESVEGHDTKMTNLEKHEYGRYKISAENLQKIKDSVVSIDAEAMNNMTRAQIIIGMYGGIKDPETGKRFSIPYLTFSDENYIFRYADFMRTLVHEPETFEKIMNWE